MCTTEEEGEGAGVIIEEDVNTTSLFVFVLFIRTIAKITADNPAYNPPHLNKQSPKSPKNQKAERQQWPRTENQIKSITTGPHTNKSATIQPETCKQTFDGSKHGKFKTRSSGFSLRMA